MSMYETEDGGTSKNFLTALILLWLSGVGLRITVLAIPPVIPQIHRVGMILFRRFSQWVCPVIADRRRIITGAVGDQFFRDCTAVSGCAADHASPSARDHREYQLHRRSDRRLGFWQNILAF